MFRISCNMVQGSKQIRYMVISARQILHNSKSKNNDTSNNSGHLAQHGAQAGATACMTCRVSVEPKGEVQYSGRGRGKGGAARCREFSQQCKDPDAPLE